MQVTPWRMFRGNAGSNDTLVWDLANRGTLTLCQKECAREEQVKPYGAIRAIWVGDNGRRVEFDTNHIEHLDDDELPRHLNTVDVNGFARVFMVTNEIPVTGEQIRVVVVGAPVHPKAT